MPLSSTLGEVISTYLGYVTFFITLVILPGATLAILLQDKAYIVSEEFKFHFGVLTEGISHKSKIQLAYFGFFILRRFIFVCIIFQWIKYPTFQLQGVIFLNVFMVMYQAGVKPLEGRFNNRMETYNECLVYLITLHMMLYTKFVDRSLHETIGYSMIGLVLLYLVSNAFLVFSAAIWGLVLTG